MLRMMNRATAQQSAETSEEEGELPKSREVEDVMTDLVQTDLGYTDMEWVFSTKREVDGLKQAQIDDIYMGKAYTINEVRDELGKDPRPEAEANMLGEFTPMGFVPLDAAAQAARTTQMQQAKTDGMPEPAPVVAGPGAAPGKPAPKNQPGQAAPSKKKVLKRVGATIEPDKLTPASQKAKARIHSQLEKVFQRQKDKAVAEAKRLMKGAKVRKSDPSDEFDPDTTAELIYDSISYEWEHVPSQVRPALEESMRSGIGRGIMQLDFADDSLIASANTIAENYARDRAAEMVGMAYDDDGKLVPNPDAKWQISETTRDKIRSIVADAFKQETDISKIADAIQAALRGEADDGGIFSPYRAEMIADTEVAQAQVQGNVAAWRESGLVTKVKWLTSEDPNVCEDCQDNDEQVVAFGKPFPDGSLFPPAHPTCRCSVMVAAVSEGE
jgi:SPP1 gp7 family putative phage head morphogenesis protein